MAKSQKNNYNKSSLELLLDFQTRLQGVGNSLAADLEKLISSTDAALLKTIINNLPSAKESVKHQMWRLNKLTKEIEKIRAKGFDLAEVKAYGYGSEVVKKAGSTVAKLADNRGKIFKKELSDKKVSDIVDYHPVDGKSISQWFAKMKADDLNRITQTVQRATVEGMSVANVVKAIRGTKENDYKDGVLETTRNAATMTARTVINGVASNAMLETCAENSDVIDGIKFVATLDAKTCPFCGSYDGKIWKPDEAALVKRPPLHPNCRCTVIPYIDMGENLEGERPAANADFDKLAEDSYNQQAREKGWKRRYEDLSPSTRMKYYYQAQKDYTKKTGKPAYRQVKGDTTFKEYFEKQDTAFQKAWLGPKRYELYRQGEYDHLQLANPDTGYVVPVSELENVTEPQTAFSVPDSKGARKIIDEIESREEIKELDSVIKTRKAELEKAQADFDDALKNKNWTEYSRAYNEKRLAKEALENAEKAKREATRDEIINRLFPIDDQNSINRTNARKAQIAIKGQQAQNAAMGLDFVARILDNTSNAALPLDTVKVTSTRRRRSYYQPQTNTIYLTIRQDSIREETAPHETGHAVESLSKQIWDNTERFYIEITTDENGKRKPLEKLYKGKKEQYREAVIPTPNKYTTKEYRKRNGDFDGTEMVSVFFEELYKDPAELIKNCPEYYDGMIECLK